MDRGSPSPTFRVEQSSPLDSLVRRASSRRARVAKLADALSVPYAPSHDTVQGDYDASPHSPLLHTQFRGSVASTSPSTYDNPSFVADSNGSGSRDSESQRAVGTRYVIPFPIPGGGRVHHDVGNRISLAEREKYPWPRSIAHLLYMMSHLDHREPVRGRLKSPLSSSRPTTTPLHPHRRRLPLEGCLYSCRRASRHMHAQYLRL